MAGLISVWTLASTLPATGNDTTIPVERTAAPQGSPADSATPLEMAPSSAESGGGSSEEIESDSAAKLENDTLAPQFTPPSTGEATDDRVELPSSYSELLVAEEEEGRTAVLEDSVSRAKAAEVSPQALLLPEDVDWRLSDVAADSDLAGYVMGESALPGDPVHVKVHGTGSRLRIDVFRIGHYGGAGALWVARADTELRPQPPCSVIDRTVDCSNWAVTHTLDSTGWSPGVYLLKLTDDLGRQKYASLVLRSASHRGTVALMVPTSTHAAYNYFGNYSLYKGPTGYSDRSLTVSLNRPHHGNGAQKLYEYDLGLIQFLESLGVALSYTSNGAFDQSADGLASATTLVSLGHDEYWTPGMRSNAEMLRDAGVNLLFLSADAVYWRMRWNADRTEVTSYREAVLDPVKDSPATTTLFRSEPFPNPEAALLGGMYDCYGHNPLTDLVVVNPDFWAFEGTGAIKGSRYPGLIGHEVDKAGSWSPEGVHVAAHSSFDCASRTGTSDLTYYVASSGAGVLNLGTMGFALALSPGRSTPAASLAFVQQVLRRVVVEASLGPLGNEHNEIGNLEQVYKEPVPPATSAPLDVYTTEGRHTLNGREWRTSCEAYSTQIDRCRTEILSTQVSYVSGAFTSKTDWHFNNLTYVASPRSFWRSNPLGGYGRRGPLEHTWTSGGRQWKAECDTPTSGRGGCRAYIYGSFITSKVNESGQRVYFWDKGWIFNNMVRFTD